MLHAAVIQTVDPQTGVGALDRAVRSVEHTCAVLEHTRQTLHSLEHIDIHTATGDAGTWTMTRLGRGLDGSAEYGKNRPQQTRTNISANTDPRPAKIRFVLRLR